MKKTVFVRLTALALVLALLAALAAGCGGRATTMHLKRADGTVAVQNDKGKAVPAAENLSLYHGYSVDTRPASYAWIDLDDVKLTKLDESSEVEIRKNGKALELRLVSGSIFFNVTQPLADDETMDICTSSMVVGIRGTCGWVTTDGAGTAVALLEGQVECRAVLGESCILSAGQMAVQAPGSTSIQVLPLTQADLPEYVAEEADPQLTADLPYSGGADIQPGGQGSEDPAGAEVGGPVPAAPPPVPDDGIQRTVIEVATTEELLALAETDLSNTELHLGDGTYDVGDLALYGCENLSIIGTGNTRLVSHWGGDIILDAGACPNLLLYGLVMGHDLPPEMGCEAGVLSMYNCDGMRIVYCDIYGCGVVGISGGGDALIQHTVIRDCSESAMSWYEGTVRLEDCIISGNGYLYSNSACFNVWSAVHFTLENCTLQNNYCAYKYGALMWDESTQTTSLGTDPNSTWIENNVTETGNAW